MPEPIEELQRVWHSTVHGWRRRQLGRRRMARRYWDAIILTAANATQARGFEMEIERRREIGMIDPETQVLVVADRAGKRIGSGGATLWALKQYARRALEAKAAPKSAAGLFRGKRVLMAHCGGEGRRVPSNAGAGKLFATLPFEVLPGRAAGAFDALYVLLCACAERMDDGLVICAGDVLAVFDPKALHWKKGGCCGIGIPVPLDLASRHGVYVPDASGRRVADYLQKPAPETMRASGATVDGDRALVDGAGILKLAPEICAELAALAGVGKRGRALEAGAGLIEEARRRGEPVDLYTDIAWALVSGTNEDRYLRGLSPGKAFLRRRLWDALHGADFWLDVAGTSLFVHLGNLWQILQAFEAVEAGARRPGASGDAAAVFGARHILASHVGPAAQVDPLAHVQNSFIDGKDGRIGPKALVSECKLAGSVRIGAEALARGVMTQTDIELHDRVALFAIPLTGGRGGAKAAVYCIHGLEDNPKDIVDAGARFLAVPLTDWMRDHGVEEKDVWPAVPDGERSLWNARLHPVGGDEALGLALWMQQPGPKADRAGEWRKAQRLSFAEVFERIDYARGLQQREALIQESMLANIRRDLTERRNPRDCLDALGPAEEFIALRGHLRQWIESASNPLAAARMLAFEADLLAHPRFAAALERSRGKPAGADPALGREKTRRELATKAADAALRKVAEAVAAGVSRTQALDLSAVKARRVVIESPARIDFGGGWTDTPPQCLERGGVILSAAVQLNGRRPIRVVGERIEERVIRLESAVARNAEILSTAADLPRFQRLDDPFGLLKAALSVVGLCSQDDPAAPPLEQRLAQWGHGLRLTAESRLPKGSGLGASSILGASVIACLRRLFGAPLDVETIFRQTLYLEQLLTSGGGWQDQIGALVPAIKLAAVPADPSFVLRPNVEPLRLSEAIVQELRRRLLLFYVGKRRVAFNMLREIVVGYLSGNPDVTHALQAIHDIAYEMREALLAADFDRFGALLTRTRMLYRLMCPGTTSDVLETLFAAAAPYCSGGKCVGAGGGGFIMAMARSAADAQRVRERLKQFSWRGLGEFYDFDIDPRGLHVAEEAAL